MKLLKIIRDTDVGLDIPEPSVYKEVRASRGVIWNEARDKIAIFHVSRKLYHKLPGGEVEEGESLEEALRREILEETGYNIKNIIELGATEEYFNELGDHQTSYCFIADKDGGKNALKLTPPEISSGSKVKWMSLREAIQTLESETNIADSEGRIINARELIFLREAERLHEKDSLNY